MQHPSDRLAERYRGKQTLTHALFGCIKKPAMQSLESEAGSGLALPFSLECTYLVVSFVLQRIQYSAMIGKPDHLQKPF